MIQGVNAVVKKDGGKSATDVWNTYAEDELYSILEQHGTEETVPKGAYLYRVGQPQMPDVILLKKGAAKACQITVSGEEHIYNFFRSGSNLFLLACVTNEPPALDFIATSQCHIVRIPLEVLSRVVREDGRLARTIMADTGKRLSSAYKRLRECESYNTEWKLCNMLLSMAGRSGVEYEGKILIREKVSQQTMAGMLRVSRITVARTLKVLRDLALIETVNGHICIRDESALLQHMHYISIPLD